MATEDTKDVEEPEEEIESMTGDEVDAEPLGLEKFLKSGEIRDLIKERFKPQVVKEIMANIMKENLADKVYDAEEVVFWTQNIADQIKEKVKELNYDHYKIVVKIHLVQLSGQGLKMSLKGVWDQATDYFAHENYISKTLACSALCCGVFAY